MNGDGFAAGGGDGLQALPAQNGTQARTACGALVGDDTGVFHQILTGRTDAELAEFCFAGQLCELFLTFTDLR